MRQDLPQVTAHKHYSKSILKVEDQRFIMSILRRDRRNYALLPTYQRSHSSVAILNVSGNRLLWSVGTERVMRETPHGTPSQTPFDESAVYRLVSSRTNIPIPRIYDEWVDHGVNKHFIIRQRVDGTSLKELWPTMTAHGKEVVADQTAAYLNQLRAVTEPWMGRVNCTPLYDHLLFNTVLFEPHGPFYSDDQLWAAMAATLSPEIDRRALERLRQMMPPCAPYTFTHGDLSLGNIIIKNGNVVGLIDWEWSGFFPVWWEYSKFSLGTAREIDTEWWTLLSRRIQSHPAAHNFALTYRRLVFVSAAKDDPDRREEGLRALEELLR